MQQNIWSSPQVGGSGGALKALARNVANHLKLNRTAMKRVVAQVVAEHHSLGEVADYKGHMYFAKPDRLNFTELIAQSKEAFDDLLLHEPRLVKRIQAQPQVMGSPRPKFQRLKSPSRQRASVKAARSRILKMAKSQLMCGSKVAPPPRKQCSPSPKKRRSRSGMRLHRKKSSTTEFQLEDAGTVRSLNGVIIEDNHLPQVGEHREILLHVPQAAGPAKKLRRRGRRTSKLHVSQQDLGKAPSMEAAPKPTPAHPASANPGSARRVLSRRSQRQINAGGRRLVAGSIPSPQPSPHPIQQKQQAPSKKPPVKKKFMAPRHHKKTLPLLQRTYEKPWLVRRRRKRLSGGYQKTKPATGKAETVASVSVAEKEPERLDKISVEWVEKNSEKEEKSEHSVRSKEEPKVQRPSGRRQMQSHVGRQMRNVNFPWYTPYQFQGAAGATRHPNMEAGMSAHRLSLQRSHLLNTRRNMSATPIPPLKRKQNFTTRQRHHRRMQERFLRDLQREEAIDEPQSNGSGMFRRRRVWQQQQEPQDAGGNSAPTKSKAASPDRKSLERVSSRTKRFRQPAASGERISPARVTGGGVGGAGGTVGAAAGPAASASSAPSPRRRRRRNRYVPVGSSLGSIAGLGAGQPQDSKHSLTPAKRHLTIAFMNKRDERGHHRQATQHWK